MAVGPSSSEGGPVAEGRGGRGLRHLAVAPVLGEALPAPVGNLAPLGHVYEAHAQSPRLRGPAASPTAQGVLVMHVSQPSGPFFDIEQAAVYIGRNVAFMRRLVARRALPHYKLGRALRF